MKDSMPKYAIYDSCSDFTGIVWETELGKIVTVENKMSVNGDLAIYNIETNEKVNNIDLRNVLMSILPTN